MTSASASGADVDLVIGPLLRYVSADEATIWVETNGPCTVKVTLDDGPESSADTWSVHGHHFAIVMIEGLEGGKIYPYRVELDGTECWPVDDGFPHSVIRPPSRDDRLRVTFGSCRRTAPFDRRLAGLQSSMSSSSKRSFAIRMTPPSARRTTAR